MQGTAQESRLIVLQSNIVWGCVYPKRHTTPFFMSKRTRYRYLLRTIRTIDVKCDRILNTLNVIHGDCADSMLDCIKESARDMYMSSLEERRRTERAIDIRRHD